MKEVHTLRPPTTEWCSSPKRKKHKKPEITSHTCLNIAGFEDVESVTSRRGDTARNLWVELKFRYLTLTPMNEHQLFRYVSLCEQHINPNIQ